MGWQDAPIVQRAGENAPAWQSAPVVAQETAPQEGDPVPSGGAPKGFYAVTGDDGKQTLRREVGPADIVRWLGDMPGVGAAERLGQGAVNLGSKALSGLAGVVSGGNPDVVRQVQQATHVDLPPSSDPLVQASEAVQRGAQAVAAPIDKAVGNLPAGPRTVIEGAEEALPDVATLAGMRGALPEQAASTAIARSPTEVAKAAGYTGLRTRADLHAPGNQAITDTLIKQDAGMLPEQVPSVAALENARKVGPGKVYAATEQSLPLKLTQDATLRADLTNLPQQTSQLPRSPDVEALQEVMLQQPEMTRDELFANIREARERAKAHWKSDDPDKAALGDAYAHLADAYEGFVGRQLEANNARVALPDWQAARVQMAKNYQAQGALRGESFNPQVYGKIAERNPHLLTGNAAIVGHVANGLPASSLVGMADIGPAAGGALAGEALGQHMGVPGVGAVAGAVGAPLIRAKLENLVTRGRPALATQTGTNPALSYFFDQGRLPSGWNRAPSSPLPSFGGYLPAPSMVNAGGGASTASALESLGLTPDVQAAGAQHPAAARLQALREQLSHPPMEQVEFQGPQKWGDFSVAPPQSNPVEPSRVQSSDVVPFAGVLEQGGNQAKPVGGVSRIPPRPAPQSPKGPKMRTPPGAPETTAEPISAGPSPAQAAFRNKLAADRLRKLAGDLRLEGPGGATGDPIERLRAALERRERGYAAGGEVLNFAKRGAATLMERIENAFHNPYTADAAQLRQDIAKYWRTATPAAQAAEHAPPALLAAPKEPSLDDLTRELHALAPSAGQPDAMLLQPGFLAKPQAFADGGEVPDSSITDVAEAARALNLHSTPQAAQDRARIATNLASLFYGLDDKGNPAFGGRAWTSSQGGTPMGLLDALTATPHEGVQTLAALASLADQGRQKLGLPGKSVPASFWNSIDPSWSQAAAARLAQLKTRVQNASGVAPSQSLEDKVLDAVTDPALVAPLGAARLVRGAPLLRNALNWSAGGMETAPQQAGAQ